MLGINSACLYFTGSRGGWIGLIAMIAALLLLCYVWWRNYLPRFWRKWLLPIVFGGLAILFAIALLLIEPLRLRSIEYFCRS